MEQDVVWTLVGFGFLAVAIIAIKIYVHTRANKMAAERKASEADASAEDKTP